MRNGIKSTVANGESGSKKILMVIAQNGFRDEEYEKPKAIFKEAGYDIKTASQKEGEAEGKLGAKAKVDLAIYDVDVNQFDAVIFVGGPGVTEYLEDQKVLGLARNAYEAEKVVAAICIAPSILANAGILQGKNATAFPSEEENLNNNGAKYTGENVTVDGQIVTADGPDSAVEFGEEVVRILTG